MALPVLDRDMDLSFYDRENQHSKLAVPQHTSPHFRKDFSGNDILSEKSGGNNPVTMASVAIIFMGLPGSTKSTQARALAEYLDAEWINRDEKGSAMGFATAVVNSKSHTVVLDQCHHTMKSRVETINLLSDGCRIVWVVMKHPDDSAAMTKNAQELCLSRIYTRKGHRTLKAEDASKTMKIFAKKWVPLTPNEFPNAQIITVDMRAPAHKILTTILEKLKVDVDPARVAETLFNSRDFEARLVKPAVVKTD